jgi:tRNA pseudouridine13 synthase
MTFPPFSDFQYAFGEPILTALLKQRPEDFVVHEIMDFQPSGEGEHLWIWAEKKGQNSEWLRQQLAKRFNLPIQAVGMSGKKDRQAVSRQWFSLHLPGKQTPDLSQLNLPGVHVLQQARHAQKLKMGSHVGNQFQITLRNLQGLPREKLQDEIETRLKQIQQYGAPNYFGEQRFGHGLSNLEQADKLLRGKLRNVPKHLKGLYYSAARSWMFNHVLSQRLSQNALSEHLLGDVYLTNSDSRPLLPPQNATQDELLARQSQALQQGWQTTAPLAGDGSLGTQSDALALEEAVFSPFTQWIGSLQRARIRTDRRAIQLKPENLSWQWHTTDGQTDLTLTFVLPKGSFATAVIREIVRSGQA